MSSTTNSDMSLAGASPTVQNRRVRYAAISSCVGTPLSQPAAASGFCRLAAKYRENRAHSVSLDSTVYQATSSTADARLAAIAVLPVPERPEIRVAGNWARD